MWLALVGVLLVSWGSPATIIVLSAFAFVGCRPTYKALSQSLLIYLIGVMLIFWSYLK